MSSFFPPSLSHVRWHGWSRAAFRGAVESLGEIIVQEMQLEDAAAATVPSSARNMLPCMERDADSTFAVLSFLEIKDISRLATTCSAWKRWIHAPHAHTKRAVWAQAHAFPNVVKSWACPYIDELRLGALPAPAPTATQRLGYLFARPFIGLGLLGVMARPFALVVLHHLDERWHPLRETLTGERTDRQTLQVAHRSLELLPRLPALRSLSIQLACLWLEPFELRKCFSSLSSRLEVLCVMFMHDNAYGLALMQQLLDAVTPLKSLRSLAFTANLPYDPRSLPFDALTTLPRLESLEMHVTEMLWVCSARQLDCLCVCPALTSLSCGSFGPTFDDLGDDIYEGQSEEDRQATVHGLERLIASKQGQGAGSSAASSPSASSSSSTAASSRSASSSASAASSRFPLPSSPASSDSASPGTPVAWRHFNLKSTRTLTPSLWTALQASASSLEALEPNTWSLDFPSEDWGALSKFTSLRRLILAADLDPAVFMGGLLSAAGTLRRLEFTQVTLRAGDLASILRAAPLLAELLCSMMPLECSALVEAGPALASLQLGRILDAHKEHFIQLRSELPSMPHLTHLLLADDDETRLTAEEAEPLNDALLKRCPKLSPDHFLQNLAD